LRHHAGLDARLRGHDGLSRHLRRGFNYPRKEDERIRKEQQMAISPLAGKPADPSILINVPRLVTAYYTGRPDPSVPAVRHTILHTHRCAGDEQKATLEKLSPEMVTAASLAGEPIRNKLTRAPGDGAPIGGLKVVTDNGWFAARPSGTENIYKIYAESFKDAAHLDAIVSEAQEIVNKALAGC